MSSEGEPVAGGPIPDRPRLQVRRLKQSDYQAVAELQRKGFPDMQPWTREQFRSQLKIFPEGQLCVELDGVLVASSSSLIIDSADMDDQHTFNEACDGGFIRNHDPDGDTLYGIDIVVDPQHRGQKLARRLYDARKQLCHQFNLRRFVFAGRMPGYAKHSDAMDGREYVRRVVAKELRDPVITTQLANGFTIRAVIPDYMPSDKESRGHAVLMVWLNHDFAPKGRRRLGRGSVRVASVQYQMRTVSSVEDFEGQCEFFIDTASDYRCDFLLFPELLTTQLLPLVPAERPGIAARNLTQFTKQYVDFFNRMAIAYAVNIIAGSHMTAENGRLYNISYLFRRDGSIEKQYKIHITPSESRWWGVSPGSRMEVFDTDCGKIAILICYDSEFPELARIATKKGANILFIPYNTDIRSGHIRVRSCAQARCIENHVYCVLSGAVGNLPLVEGADIHYAQSCILTPSDISFARDGVATEATPNAETMLVHDLDLDVLRRTRRTGTVRPWIDRRTDLYQVRYRSAKDAPIEEV